MNKFINNFNNSQEINENDLNSNINFQLNSITNHIILIVRLLGTSWSCIMNIQPGFGVIHKQFSPINSGTKRNKTKPPRMAVWI